MPPHRVGCLGRFVLKTGIHFAHFGLELGMVIIISLFSNFIIRIGTYIKLCFISNLREAKIG